MRDDRASDRPVRRTCTAADTLAMLEAYEGASSPGEAGALAGLGPQPRPDRGADAAELGRLRRRAERAEAELPKARLGIEIQGTVAEREDEKPQR